MTEDRATAIPPPIYTVRRRQLRRTLEAIAPNRILAITGSRGSGKTVFLSSLAAELKRSHRDVHIWAIGHKEDKSLWLDSVGELVQALPARDATRYLLLDDAPSDLTADDFERLLPGTAIVVATTWLNNALTEYVFRLDKLEEDEALRLLLANEGGARDLFRNLEDTRALILSLEGHPLALSIAAQYLRSHDMQVDEFIQFLSNSPTSFWEATAEAITAPSEPALQMEISTISALQIRVLSVDAISALFRLTPERASSLIRRLLQVGFISLVRPSPIRASERVYRVSPLLHTHRIGTGAANDRPPLRVVNERLLTWYLYQIERVVEAFGRRAETSEPESPPQARRPSFGARSFDTESAERWVSLFADDLIGMPDRAAEQGNQTQAWQLALVGSDLLRNRLVFRTRRTLLESALKWSQAQRDDFGTIRCYVALGYLHTDNANFSVADQLFEEAFRLSKECGLLRWQATALGGRGLIALRQDKFFDAEEHFRRSIGLNKRCGFSRGEYAARKRLAEAQLAQGKVHEAQRTFSDAGELAEKHGYDTYFVDAQLKKIRERASLPTKAQKRSEASPERPKSGPRRRQSRQRQRRTATLETAIERARAVGDLTDLCNRHYELANLKVADGDFTAARESFDRSASAAKAVGLRRPLARAYVGIVRCEFELGNLKDALRTGRHALRTAAEGGETATRNQATFVLAEVLEALGSRKEAISALGAEIGTWEEQADECFRRARLGRLLAQVDRPDDARRQLLEASTMVFGLVHASERLQVLVEIANGHSLLGENEQVVDMTQLAEIELQNLAVNDDDQLLNILQLRVNAALNLSDEARFNGVSQQMVAIFRATGRVRGACELADTLKSAGLVDQAILLLRLAAGRVSTRSTEPYENKLRLEYARLESNANVAIGVLDSLREPEPLASLGINECLLLGDGFLRHQRLASAAEVYERAASLARVSGDAVSNEAAMVRLRRLPGWS